MKSNKLENVDFSHLRQHFAIRTVQIEEPDVTNPLSKFEPDRTFIALLLCTIVEHVQRCLQAAQILRALDISVIVADPRLLTVAQLLTGVTTATCI
ncbi:hypothetical protein Lal_00042317 [Lupinus albus]|nr:hypothetical protein Lal_00042317 [Lupinus albus]